MMGESESELMLLRKISKFGIFGEQKLVEQKRRYERLFRVILTDHNMAMLFQ
jgi:hypothetical protein